MKFDLWVIDERSGEGVLKFPRMDEREALKTIKKWKRRGANKTTFLVPIMFPSSSRLASDTTCFVQQPLVQ